MSGEFDRKMDNDEDEMLELEASVARLSTSGEDHDTATRLRIVDHLMMSAPLVRPGVDFAERVIEAIRHQDFDSFNRYSAFGMIVGLGVAAGVVISILSVFALVMANVVFNWTRVYQLAISLAGGVGGALANAYEWTGSLLNDSPVLGLLALASIPLFFVWVWLLRVLKPSEMRA
jgi:hypothetical protein